MKYKKISDDMLFDAVKNSTSMMGVLRYLDIKEAGGSHSHYKRRITILNLDTSHFTRKSSSKGKVSLTKRDAKSILIERFNGRREKSSRLVRALLEIGREHKCEKCGQLPEWFGNKLTLDVDHINENWLDDREENLRFLCPNCHSQFSRNLIDPIKPQKKSKQHKDCKIKCLLCDNNVKTIDNKYCSNACAKKSQIPINFNDVDLVKLVECDKISYRKLGLMYGVSDNTIKKWYLRKRK